MSCLQESALSEAPSKPSRFTYRHLAQLASYSTSSPLRVVAHVDLDAFYAQCEMVRLGVPEDQPLAVQQWQNLIAVNYAARPFGVSRHCTAVEAKKRCPSLVAQHVATWREGDDTWAYHVGAADHPATHKVALDPYRRESRRIMAVIADHLPPAQRRIEKAGIDEVFLDLSAHVRSVLLARFELGSDRDPEDNLPSPPPVSALSDWEAEGVMLAEQTDEDEGPDWDDVALLVGAEIVRNVRAEVRARLGYTCSAGVARNKMLAKLGSAHHKPNGQTVVGSRAVGRFLAGFRVTQIRSLGGKLGARVVEALGSDAVGDLLAVSPERLRADLGVEAAAHVYDALRGIDSSEVSARTRIQSMLSAKSFPPPGLRGPDQAAPWLRIFAADIASRLAEDDEYDGGGRRPGTMHLYHRPANAAPSTIVRGGVKSRAAQSRSCSGPLPRGKRLDVDVLLDCAGTLLARAARDEGFWPCAHLGLSVGGFQDGPAGNMGIGAFLVRGHDDDSAVYPTPPDVAASGVRNAAASSPASVMTKRQKKQHRAPADSGIHRFFSRRQSSDDELGPRDASPTTGTKWRLPPGPFDPAEHPVGGFCDEVSGDDDAPAGARPNSQGGGKEKGKGKKEKGKKEKGKKEKDADDYVCPRCGATAGESEEERRSHQDWHLATDLQHEEDERERRGRVTPGFASRPPPAPPLLRAAGGAAASSRRAAKRPKREQDPGQSKLKFG